MALMIEEVRSRGLELRRLTKHFGRVAAVDDVSFTVEKGSFVTLLGPSGSGKTTMLRMIAGFELPTAGEIWLDGRDISARTPAERQIGMVFQNYALFPHLSVADNIAYGLRARGIGRAAASRRVSEMLELVRLPGVERRLPNQLSGGQQQRIALARALAFEPQLLLMDEPLGALDRELRLDMEAELGRIHRELGTTVVYVTHDQDEALALSDRIAIMRNGHLIAYGSTRSIFDNPPTAFVAAFVSRCNIFSAAIHGYGADGTATVAALGQTLSVPSASADRLTHGRLAVRRDGFSLSEIAGAPRVTAGVTGIVFRGESVEAVCRASATDETLVLRTPAAGIELSTGQQVTLWMDITKTHLVGAD